MSYHKVLKNWLHRDRRRFLIYYVDERVGNFSLYALMYNTCSFSNHSTCIFAKLCIHPAATCTVLSQSGALVSVSGI